MRPTVLTKALAAFVLSFAAPAAAQSGSGEIDLSVLDAGTSKPLSDARTFLLGAQTASALTSASGAIKFTDVPVGIYRLRVQLRGYDPATTREFDVLADRAVHVRFELSKRAASADAAAPAGASDSGRGSNLKVIGVVKARPSISITSASIDAQSPIRRISDSLTDALDKLAGVSVTADATDPTSAVQVSLHNQDESQTALTLDGIPLSAPGVAGNLRSIGTDVFSGSRVSFSPSAGSLAGGVNFMTLQPTQALQLRLSGTTGTFDRSNYSFAATGSTGRLGFVLQHTWRAGNSPLTFQDYLDQSGLSYAHEGEFSTLSDLVKLRYSLADQRTSITATALDTNRNAYAICAQNVTILPCGIGPNNRAFGRYGMAYANVQSLVGNVETTLSAYTNSSATTNDDLHRYVLAPNSSSGNPDAFGPLLDPSLSIGNTVARGIAYSASVAQGRHTFTLGGSTYAATSSSDPVVGTAYQTAYTNAASSTTYRLSDAIKANDHLTVTPSVSFADTSAIGGSVLGGASATWTPRAADAYALTLNVGSSQPNLNASRSFSDPLSARFNCQAQTAVVSGPGDSGNGQHQSAAGVSAAWTHQFPSGSSLSLDAYSQVQSGQLIGALIGEPLSYYASAGPGYLETLYSAYRSPAVCGASAAVPAVYVQESVGGTRRVYSGFDVVGRFALSPDVELLPSYSVSSAVLTAAGARLSDGPSTTIVGAQLPDRPVHRGGLTVDALLARSGIEVLANAQYTGPNNQQNLGPYVNVSVGASHRLGSGQLTVFENNVFNAYGGNFATDAFARPLPLSSGGSLLTAATPLTPRSIFASYSLTVGGPAPAAAFGRFGAPSQTAAQPTAAPTTSDAPLRGPRFVSNPPPPGVDPLSLATGRATCDGSAQAAAKPIYDALHGYVAAYEHGTALPTVPNMTIVPHKPAPGAVVSYYLELRPNFQRPAGAPPGGGAPGFGPPRGPGAFGGQGQNAGGAPPGPAAGDIVARSSAEPSSVQNDAARRAFLNSPAVRAYRAFVGCAYVTILSTPGAKARGIEVAGGRPGLFYVSGIGLAFVQPVQLPQGGGSLRQPRPR